MLRETINRHLENYFKNGKATEAIGKMLLHNDGFLAPIAPFVQTQAMDANTDHQTVDVFRSTSMATGANKDAALATEASVVHKAMACTNSKCSNEESSKGRKSRGIH